MSQAQVLARVRRAWAAVVPSLWENFPNTCIEAMGVGQVVLGSRSGGQAEMIAEDGVNGFLFDWNVAGEFEHKLNQVLALTPTERHTIGQQAMQRIRALCNPEQVLNQRIAHIEQVIEQTTTRRMFPSLLEAQLPIAPIALREAEQAGLLSVVIPFYNLGAYIAETVASVLAASYRPLEIVVVDDGSTDPASIASLNQLAAGHPEMRVVRVPNGGLALARNLGADAAHGEFLAFLDADDTVEPEYYARAIDVLRRYDNVAFVYSWVRWFEAIDQIWPTWNAEFPYLLGHNMLAAFVVMPRARFLQAARNKPEIAYSLEDFEAWITLVEAGGVGVSLPHPLVNYRIRKGSMFRSSQRDQQLYLYELISELHPQAYQRWGAELFHLQNANGPAYTWNHPAIAYTPPDDEIQALQPLRDAMARGIWMSDMLRGGRIVANVRRSWLVRMLRDLGGLRLMRHALQLFRRR
jgi:glycosyltransferase involved in cell wall biosynthesis